MSPVGACKLRLISSAIPTHLLHKLLIWSATVPRRLFPAPSRRRLGLRQPLGDVRANRLRATCYIRGLIEPSTIGPVDSFSSGVVNGPLLARNGHADCIGECPFLGAKRK